MNSRIRYFILGIVSVLAVGFFGAVGGASTSSSTAVLGPEGIPLELGQALASLSTAATGRTVDGIRCDAHEQVVYHVHSHLSVYVNGKLRPIPAGVGLASPISEQTPAGPFFGATRCYYWLHVHAQDGVIHIESPTARTYTLGNFFDIWGQPLSANQIGSARGTLHVYVDGRLYRGSPRNIGLKAHEVIQIDVDSPVVSAQSVNWSLSQL